MAFEKIIVMGRNAAGRLDLDVRYAVISINDGNEATPIKRTWGLSNLLVLHFADVGNPQMSADQASQVWSFVRSVGVRTLVIHCFAGVSRSISVAMAIADVTGMGRLAIEWQSKPWHAELLDGPPNRHVYDLVKAAASPIPVPLAA